MFSEGPTRKIIGLIISILGSIGLVFLLVFTPVYTQLINIFSPDNMATILQSVDFTEMLAENIVIEDDDENTVEIIKTIMKSDATKELMDLYVEDLKNISTGNQTYSFSKDNISQVLDKHSDALLEDLSSNPQITLSKEELQAELDKVIKEHSGDIADLLPPVDTMEEAFEQEEMSFVSYRMTGALVSTAYLAGIIVLSLAIFFGKLYRLKGLIILGIDYIIGAALTFAISVFVGSDFLVDPLNAEISGFGSVLLNISNYIRNWSLTIGVLALLFLLAGIIGGKLCKNVEASRKGTDNPFDNNYNNQYDNPYNNPYNNDYNNQYNNPYNNQYNNYYDNNNNNNQTGI